MSAVFSHETDLPFSNSDPSSDGVHILSQAQQRNGPNPLALHIWYAMILWLSVIPFWPLLTLPAPTAMTSRQRKYLNNYHTKIKCYLRTNSASLLFLQLAISQEAFKRIEYFIKGILAYQNTPLARHTPTSPPLYSGQWGSATLLDYGACDAEHIAFIIPSLINTPDHLDHLPETSFLNYLRSQKIRPLVFDWGTPGVSELCAGMHHYCFEKLLPALQYVKRTYGKPVVIGHCMGGTLSVAALSRRPDLVKGFIALATPWNFSKMPAAPFMHMSQQPPPAYSIYPKALTNAFLQTAFTATDPFAVPLKYYKFGHLITQIAQNNHSVTDDRSYRSFIALEDWVNSDRPLPLLIAHECQSQWYKQNKPYLGQWHIQGHLVKPYLFCKPALIVAPKFDSVVPPSSALGLMQALPGSTKYLPDCGHVSFFTTETAQHNIWPNIVHWIQNC